MVGSRERGSAGCVVEGAELAPLRQLKPAATPTAPSQALLAPSLSPADREFLERDANDRKVYKYLA